MTDWNKQINITGWFKLIFNKFIKKIKTLLKKKPIIKIKKEEIKIDTLVNNLSLIDKGTMADLLIGHKPKEKLQKQLTPALKETVDDSNNLFEIAKSKREAELKRHRAKVSSAKEAFEKRWAKNSLPTPPKIRRVKG